LEGCGQDDLWFDSLARQEIFLFPKMFNLGPTHPIHLVNVFQGFASTGVEQLVYVVVHELFQVQEHNLLETVAVCVTALACSVVMFGNKGFHLHV
jgi:hypothetical protein